MQFRQSKYIDDNQNVVFRVQDSDGRGPFRPGFSKYWVQEREDHNKLVPWFIEFGDVRKKLLIGEFCGSACLTKTQLKRWFTKNEYKKLKNFGYSAVEIQVDRIIDKSEIQCFIGRSRPLNEEVKKIKLYGI